MIHELTTIKTNNNKKAAYNNKNNKNNHFLLKSFNLYGSRNQVCKLINKNIINTREKQQLARKFTVAENQNSRKLPFYGT